MNKDEVPDYNIKLLEDRIIVNGIEGFEKFINFISMYCEKGIDLYLPKIEFHFKSKGFASTGNILQLIAVVNTTPKVIVLNGLNYYLD